VSDLNIDMVIMMKLNEIIHNHDEVILIKKTKSEYNEMLTYLEQNEMDKFHLLNSINESFDHSSEKRKSTYRSL